MSGFLGEAHKMNESPKLQQILDDLRKPFHPSQVTWKPGAVKGERALALAYADLRAYMNRLDEVCGTEWSVAYEPWGDDRIICRLTICGVVRSSTGETDKESERGEIGGTVAEAQAFKRASAMFGLGRYLYNLPSGWADYDPAKKQFTDKAKAKLTAILVQQYRRANDVKSEMAEIYAKALDTDTDSNGDAVFSTEQDVANVGDTEFLKKLDHFNALGEELYKGQWPQVRQRNVVRVSGGKVNDTMKLTSEQIQMLIDGMMTLKSKRQVTEQQAA